MFKKLVLMLSFTSSLAFANPTNVHVVWPSDIGGTQANRVRYLVEQGNLMQDKYRFIFINKPGAGGTIGANYLETSSDISVMVWTSSWFVRPIFYPNASYDINQFKPVMIQCTGFPYTILSKKYKSLKELKAQKSISIGTIPGSAAESLVRELQKQLSPDTEVVFIPYPSMGQPRLDVIGGQIDANVDLGRDSEQWVTDRKLNVIGISGTKSFGPYRSFSSQNIHGFEKLTSVFFIVTKKSLDPVITQELAEIFKKINRTPDMQQQLNDDFCTPRDLDEKQTNELYNKWVEYWPSILQPTPENKNNSVK